MAELSHFAVIYFAGDPTDEHPDPELAGRPPSLELIACGSEDHCWEALAAWTLSHPLREGETAEVLTREARER